VDHPVEACNGPVAVGDHREVDLGALRLGDVVRPSAVILGGVDRHCSDLRVTPGKFGFKPGGRSELRGADRSEVGGMGEQYSPTLAEPFMETQFTGGGLCREIRGEVTYLERHFSVLLQSEWRAGKVMRGECR
jgi:hypothetical protein